MLRWLTIPLLVSGLTGCDEPCTLIGCDDRLEVDTSAALPDRYTVEMTLDGKSGSAACDLMGESSQGVRSGPLVAGVTCRRAGFLISGLYVSATLRVLAEDGTLLGESSFEPDYEGQYPNGVDCGDACQSARADLHIAPTP